MDRLIHQAIALLKEETLLQGSVLATPEETVYFSPQKKQLPPKRRSPLNLMLR